MNKIKVIKSVSIIGAGNVGWHLARAIDAAGIEVRHIISPTIWRSKEVADMVHSKPLTKISDASDMPDLMLICSSDLAITEILKEIDNNYSILAHTSGSIGIEVFRKRENPFGVFYPLQTFTRESQMNYTDIPFLIEAGSNETLQVLANLAEKISGSWHHVTSANRKKIHLAAVFACNFSNHMVSIASRILSEEGMDLELLKPILHETINKLETLDPEKAQTGPAVRNDRQIIEDHLDILASKPNEQELYKLLSENILRYKQQ